MKTVLKLFTVFALALSALGVSTSTVLAAPPANDTFPNATLVTVGFGELLDTTEATTDADDAQLNASCGETATDASVWYAIEGTDTEIVIDVSQADYPASVLVGVGTQGNLFTVTCGLGALAFFAAAGTTYYVLAIDNQLDGGGNGGNLSISFNEIPPPPPPPTLEISVNRDGTFNSKTGTATISGTYTCTNGDIFVFIEARQTVGRFLIFGFGGFFDFGTCDGEPHPWSAEIVPDNGVFRGGKLLTVTFAESCGPFACASRFVEQSVQLRGG